MSVEKGVSITNLIAGIGVDISDAAHVTWTASMLLNYINDAIDKMASEFLLRRTDIIPCVSGQGFYELTCEIARVEYLTMNGVPLTPKTEGEISLIYGSGWRTETGDPLYYTTDRLGVRLVPAPGNSGTALTFAGDPAITEGQGTGPMGSAYKAAMDGTTVVHFLEDDGEVSGWPGGTFQLEIYYSYQPVDSDEDGILPLRYRKAVVAYTIYRAFVTSESPDEQKKAGFYLDQWADSIYSLKRRNADGFMSAGYLPTSKNTKEF